MDIEGGVGTMFIYLYTRDPSLEDLPNVQCTRTRVHKDLTYAYGNN